MRRLRLLSFVLAAGACGVGERPPPDADTEEHPPPGVENARIMISGAGTDPALYADLRSGHRDDTLVEISVPQGRVSLHRMRHADGVMTMTSVDRIGVPADGLLRLRSGEFHGMVEDGPDELRRGDSIRVTFRFASGERLEAMVPVVTVVDVAGEPRAGHGSG